MGNPKQHDYPMRLGSSLLTTQVDDQMAAAKKKHPIKGAFNDYF
jgi:hypothetical protein